MGSFAFDTYGEKCAEAALAVLLEKRAEISQPVTWIKLQQGGQGEIWVTHVTVNTGIGRERNELDEKHFELAIEGDFPAHIDMVDEHENLAAFLTAAGLEPGDEAGDAVWELASSVLTRELLVAGHRVKERLKAAGVEVHDDCVVCCGDEDNTWGWNPSRPFDAQTYLGKDDFEDLDDAVRGSVAALMYESEGSQAWLLSLAS